MKFNELTDEQKDEMIEKYWDINIQDVDEIDDCFYAELLAEYGFEDVKISCGGFGRGGDTTFTGGVNLKAFMLKHKLYNQDRSLYSQLFISENFDGVVSIHCPSYYGREIMDVSTEFHDLVYEQTDAWDKISVRTENTFDSLAEFVLERAKELAQEIHATLEKGYDYDTSREGIIERFVECEYDFDVTYTEYLRMV